MHAVIEIGVSALVIAAAVLCMKKVRRAIRRHRVRQLLREYKKEV